MFKREQEINKKWLFLAREPRIHYNLADGYFMTESIKTIADLKSQTAFTVPLSFTTLYIHRLLLVIKKNLIQLKIIF